MTPLLEQLYKEIEHGDAEHRKWLWDKLEDFSRRKFRAYHCPGHVWERMNNGDTDSIFGWDDYFQCKNCGTIEFDPPI